MRVLTVVDDLKPGGTQRAAQNYAVGYLEAGYPSAVLAVHSGGPREAELARVGVETFVGGGPGTALSEAKAWRPDLIHIHRVGKADAASGHVIRSFRQERTTLSVIETNVFARADYSPDQALIDLHLHLSRWCLWKWSQWVRQEQPSPVGVVVPYAADGAAFYAAPGEGLAFRETHGIPSDAFVCARVGQPSVWKWHPALFRAFEEVARRHAHAWLLLVGLPAELRPHLHALAPDLRRRVIDLPFLHGDAALRACYNAADVFVHAAQIGESFGMVLAEAMLCECPVVTLSRPTRDNSQLEVVGHDEGGVVAASRAGMAEAIEALLKNPERRRQLGRGAASRIRAHFTMDRVMPQLLRLVEHAAAHPGGTELGYAVRNDPAFITKVTDQEIEGLLARAVGRPPLYNRLVMRLVHEPVLYRLWDRFKARA